MSGQLPAINFGYIDLRLAGPRRRGCIGKA
jgi:hypothetical protein